MTLRRYGLRVDASEFPNAPQHISRKISIHCEAYAVIRSRKTLPELPVPPIKSRQDPM